MSITTISERETALTHTLRTMTEALNTVTADRDELLVNAQTDEMLISAANESAARAIAERDAWIAENSPGGWIDDLRKERDALRADAGRYRWIQDHPEVDVRYGYDAEDWPVTLYTASGSINDREWTVLATGSTLSEAIDAAIKGTS